MSGSKNGPSTSVEKFGEVLKGSKRIMALCGAGLSAASGLGTFRGPGGTSSFSFIFHTFSDASFCLDLCSSLSWDQSSTNKTPGMWRNHKATTLATEDAFERDPGLVWLFYSYRRHKALEAHPNPGHYALAELSKKMPGFITLTQNVDGLSQRAHHPREQLKLLHGSLFDIKCFWCDYIQRDNYDDPFHPLLDITTEDDERLEAASANTAQASAASLDPNKKTEKIDPELLPKCPKCNEGLLRPGVVWFEESLPEDTLAEVDAFIDQEGKIDLCLVIGTTATIYPAASCECLL